jgi:hypothetical protein
MLEYGWEAVRQFERELATWFPKTYERKYSLTGNGIYNLILVNNKVYEIKVAETKKMLENNQKLTTDLMKNKILNNILNNLKENINYTVNNGKITLRVDKWIIKIEVIKKIKIPN